ncbi:hypothetical protein IU486_31250 [Streptomyces gardneri]|uniref:leucine zipper domain-containing protein n=1 Tax=Nocardia abscessus TaxID=120957 RepID=UPI00189315FC|nr:hypothetical protein [Streptomyces gardneri]MBF6475264.1 hypothetical protein [Nocardia abscessus]
MCRQWASKWIDRWHRFGAVGLKDRSSEPHRQPRATRRCRRPDRGDCAATTDGQRGALEHEWQ